MLTRSPAQAGGSWTCFAFSCSSGCRVFVYPALALDRLDLHASGAARLFLCSLGLVATRCTCLSNLLGWLTDTLHSTDGRDSLTRFKVWRWSNWIKWPQRGREAQLLLDLIVSSSCIWIHLKETCFDQPRVLEEVPCFCWLNRLCHISFPSWPVGCLALEMFFSFGLGRGLGSPSSASARRREALRLRGRRRARAGAGLSRTRDRSSPFESKAKNSQKRRRPNKALKP